MPQQLSFRDEGTQVEVSPATPYPVALKEPIKVKRYTTEAVIVPGIVISAAYGADDAVGTKFQIPVLCTSGVIEGVVLVDLSAQAAAVDLLLFEDDFTGGTDNSPFDLADAERSIFIGHINVPAANHITFGSTEALGTVKDVGFAFTAPSGVLHCQLTTQGTPTHDTANPLTIRLVVRQD